MHTRAKPWSEYLKGKNHPNTVRQTEHGIPWNQTMCEGMPWADLSENRISYTWRLTFELHKRNGVIYRQSE